MNIIYRLLFFFFILCISACSQSNHTLWEYEGGGMYKMTFDLNDSGGFVYCINSPQKLISKGSWRYSDDKKAIYFKFLDNAAHWDKVIFSKKDFPDKYALPYFSAKDRELGLDIQYSDYSKESYFNFLGYLFYKK
jgi:hypothetical protein